MKNSISYQESMEQRLAELNRERDLLVAQNEELWQMHTRLRYANKKLTKKNARLEAQTKKLKNEFQPNDRAEHGEGQNAKKARDNKSKGNAKPRRTKIRPKPTIQSSQSFAFVDRRKSRGTYDNEDDHQQKNGPPSLTSEEAFPPLG